MSPVAGARGAHQISRFEIFILTSTLGSPSSCQMRRLAPPAWLLLRGMRPLLTAHVRASDVASRGALHAPRKLDLARPPFWGQARGRVPRDKMRETVEIPGSKRVGFSSCNMY